MTQVSFKVGVFKAGLLHGWTQEESLDGLKSGIVSILKLDDGTFWHLATETPIPLLLAESFDDIRKTEKKRIALEKLDPDERALFGLEE